MSSTVHMIVGSLTLILFVISAVMYAIEWARGQVIVQHRIIAFAAATLLLLQYALGFMLLGAGNKFSWTHVLFALLAIVPVGMEHGMAAKQPGLRKRAMIGLVATILTVALVLITYLIGEKIS